MIHLHTHTAKDSFLDSTNRSEGLSARAKELGMPAIAITGHGYVSSHVDFYMACKEDGVKPILGCELYVCEDMKVQDPNSRYDHLIVLAKNDVGYKNLLTVVSIGFTEGFYYKPRVDMEVLRNHSEGLLVASACLGGEIPRMILKGMPWKEIQSKVVDYAVFFDNYYLEVQGADNPEQMKVNQALAKLSNELDIPLVATSDVHFLRQEDFELHGLFIQANEDRDNELYQDCWLKSEEEMFDVLYKHIGFDDAMQAIINTHVISDMCNVELKLGVSYLPKFPIPNGFVDEVAYFRHLINKGFVTRGLDKLPSDLKQVYINRLKEEFDIITRKNYTGYFLIVMDFLQECRDVDIYLGDGRGSADNSLVCYVLEITNVDSIFYDLNFSRFLTVDRVELPDIDIDVQSSRKPDSVNILRRKYKKVAQICTFQAMQAKSSMDKLGKVLAIPYDEIVKIKKLIPDNMKLKEAIDKNSHLVQYKEKYPRLFEVCIALEGLVTGISVHAGGVVIVPEDMDMSDFTAVCFSSEKEIITQLEMHDVESVGLVKMDVLATTTLDVIADSLDLIFGEG